MNKVNSLVLLACLGLGLGLAACHGDGPKGDPDHGVSNASYRDALQTTRDKLTKIQKRFEASRDEDLALEHPFHPRPWWDSQIAPVIEAIKLDDAALSGTNATVAPVTS